METVKSTEIAISFKQSTCSGIGQQQQQKDNAYIHTYIRGKGLHLISALTVTRKCPSIAHSEAACKRSVASSSPSSEEHIARSMPGSGLGSSAMDFT